MVVSRDVGPGNKPLGRVPILLPLGSPLEEEPLLLATEKIFQLYYGI